jgi:hypothetical protein
MLKLALRIIRDSEGMSEDVRSLKLKNVSLQFTRRNYENVQSKSQVLVSMLQQDKIHPRLAFTSSGLFTDPESAYQLSKEYFDSLAKEYPETNEVIEEANE